MIVFMHFQPSPSYECLIFLGLCENIRLQAIRDDPETDHVVLGYPSFLLKVGEGKPKQTIDFFIELPLCEYC